MAVVALRNVFVYGSLLAPEVLSALLHRVPPSSLAVVHNYHRYSIKNRIYPAVLPSTGDKVFGKVLFDLSDQELQILDDFEDIEYIKLIVSPCLLNAFDVNGELVDNGSLELPDNAAGLERVANALTVASDETGRATPTTGDNTVKVPPDCIVGVTNPETDPLTAYMYIWANQKDPNLVGNWDYEEWRKAQLEDYVKMCEEFKSELSRVPSGS